MTDLATVVVAYNRPRHLKRVLEKLEDWKVEPLYLFSDGPRDEADAKKVDAVRDVIDGIYWTKPVVKLRKRNMGLRRSVLAAVDFALNRHETMVLLEDDVVPGPYLYEWLRMCLDAYRDEPLVLGVSSYTLRLDADLLAGYPWDAYFHPRVSSQGWATWRDRWALYVRDGELPGMLEATDPALLARAGKDVVNMVRDVTGQRSNSWTPGWLMAACARQMVYVYPTRSHMTNIGFDGSGEHCPPKFAETFDSPVCLERPARLPERVAVYPEIRERLKVVYG